MPEHPRGRERRERSSFTRGLLALPWLCAAHAQALDPGKAITQYVHDAWRTEQGLPQNSVFTICQTRDGYLWLGTEEGLARFDGVRFRVFDKRNTPELAHNFIRRLFEGSDGSLWIGTRGGGASRLANGKLTTFTTRDGLPGERVTSFCESPSGSIWIGTTRGLARLTGGRLTAFTTKDGLSNDRVHALHADREGNLWIGTDGGLNRFRGGAFTAFRAPEALSHDVVNVIREDRAGNLWIGTNGGGLNRLRDGRFTKFTTQDGLSNDEVIWISEDREGTLWIGTFGGGLDRLRDGVFTRFTAKDGLSSDEVFAILEDREGSLWIGTRAGGLDRLRDGKVTPLTTAEGLSSNMVTTVHADRGGSVWIGTLGGGLNRLRDGVVTSFTTKHGLPSDRILSTYGDREGTLWIGSDGGGLSRMRDGRISPFVPVGGRWEGTAYTIHEDLVGKLWIGTERGLQILENGRVSMAMPKEGVFSGTISAIHEDTRGTLWFGTQKGLDRLEGGRLTHFGAKDGLSNEYITSICEDADGSLWAATLGGGVNRFSDGRFAPVTTSAGLFDDTVFQLLLDDQDNLWMSCNKGIFRVARKELEGFVDGKASRVTCVPYGTADGMRSAECNLAGYPAGWKTSDGRLWFPTVRGVVVIDPSRIPRNALTPPVAIEEVLVDKVPLRAGSPAVLPPGKEKFEFHYTALSFLAPSRVRFRYRLDGFDRDWVDAGTERTAHYTNLAPRDYTFRVIACNDDGVWNETGASFALTLEPRFHQSWWFYAACAFGLAALGAGWHRARVRRLKAREQELVQVVAEKTKDLTTANVDLLRANEALREAQEQIARLLESSPGASESVHDWSRSLAGEIAAAVGARAIGIWEVERDGLTPVSDSGLTPPSRDQLEGLVSAVGQSFLESGDGVIVPVTGTTGDLCGALLVSGTGVAWGETERHLVAGFAHQLGGVLEMKKVRRQLAAAEEHRAATRREMHERGIATLQICQACRRCYDHTASTCSVDGSPLDSPRPLPYLLLDRYRFLQVLGQGGMGLVLSAHDQKLGRDVAVKLIRPEHWSNVELRQRFEREARTVARIQHPGVVALHDSGELPDGTAFLVMEQLSGCDLGLLLKTHGRGTPSQVARLVRQGAAALRAAHRAGVIHRDVKPENVFLVDDPSGFRVKLLDFGLAKSTTVEQGLTQAGMLLGTPAYMPPEQLQGVDVDTRADVYSFAAVAYEALTGRQAVSGNEVGGVLIHVLNTVPAPVSSLVPGIPAEVDLAFASALSKDPGRRLIDIELWSASFVDILEKLPGDGSAVGWPISSGFFKRLRDSHTGTGQTLRLARA